MKEKRWIRKDVDGIMVDEMSRDLAISPVVARVLLNRGITEKEDAKRFLSISSTHLLDPFIMNDMDRCADRVVRSIITGERIIIYGDYDVDGITAVSLYLLFFRDMGMDVLHYLPYRMTEGYGMNESSIMKIKEMGVSLIITADLGTTSHREIEVAASLGIDVIVTDHHEAPEELPKAYGIINPNRRDSTYSFKGLAGVGVAFKFIDAIMMKLKEQSSKSKVFGLCNLDFDISKYLDLVALGTIADVSPMLEENRFFVREGLKALSSGARVGVRALKEVAGIDGEVGVGTVGFQLAPRINAAGRLAGGETGIVLLTTRSMKEAIESARHLDAKNRERQKIEEGILNDVLIRIRNEVDLNQASTIVLASPKWHQGVIGIVASRIAERFYLPTILISLKDDGTGKGSARSIPPLHLYKAIEQCSDYLEGFGGHKFAAGLTLRQERFDAFSRRFDEVVSESLGESDFLPAIRLDAEVRLADVTFGLIKDLDRLSPFGPANPEPVLAAMHVEPVSPRLVGNNHLKLTIKSGSHHLDAIGFDMGSFYPQLTSRIQARQESDVDIAFTPRLDTWRGEERIQMRIRDIRMASDGGRGRREPL
ncbi:MAG: single-stranded-DNA-specific exonuclease RecJ [Nitrospirae bacterium]|nr:single-stranded-DNA-specific exonuclease RecJ [Nitrospirota bacterium]